MSTMHELETTSTLFGGNIPFIEEQYESYLADPDAVSADWRSYFDSLRGGVADVSHAPVIESFIQLGKSRKVAGAMVDSTTMHKQVQVLQLISKYRTLGMFHAELDPLKRQSNRYIPDLDLRTYGFTDADIDTEFDVGSFMAGPQRMRLRDLIEALRETYCRTFGAEYMYISDTQVKRFIQARLEPIRSRPAYAPEQQAADPRASHGRRDPRALPAHQVRRPEALLRRGRRHPDADARPSHPDRRHGRRAGDGDRHGAPRPPQRAGEHAGQDAERSVLRVRGQVRAEAAGRRRQVSPGLLVRRHHARRADAPDAGVQSLAPRVGQSRRRGLGACAAAPPPATRRATRCCRCSSTAMRRSPGRASCRNASTWRRPAATTPAARSTSSSTTRSASPRPIRATRAARSTARTSRRWSRRRSST